MTTTLSKLHDLMSDRVRGDLRETVRMNLALIGVVITDSQLDGLVVALVVRLDGELRIQRLTPIT